MSPQFMDGYTRLHISFIFQQQNLCLPYVIDYHLHMFPSSRKTKYLHGKMLHQSRGLPKISMISPTPTLPQVSCGSIRWSLVSKLWDAVLQLRYTDTYTLLKPTASENRPSWKGDFIFQPSIFRGDLLVSGRVFYSNCNIFQQRSLRHFHFVELPLCQFQYCSILSHAGKNNNDLMS